MEAGVVLITEPFAATSFGRTLEYDGSIREPGGGSALSGALLRMVM